MSRGWNPPSGLHATRCMHVHSLIKGQDAQSCTLYKAPFTLSADGGSLTCPSMVAAMRSMRYLLASRSAASRKILLRSSCGRFSHALRAFRLASIAFFSKSWQQQRNVMRQNTPPLCAQIQSACMYYLMLNTAIQYFHRIQSTGLLCLRSKSVSVSIWPGVCVFIWPCVCVHLTMSSCVCVHWPSVCVHLTTCVSTDHASVSIWPCVCVHLTMCLSDHVSTLAQVTLTITWWIMWPLIWKYKWMDLFLKQMIHINNHRSPTSFPKTCFSYKIESFITYYYDSCLTLLLCYDMTAVLTEVAW